MRYLIILCLWYIIATPACKKSGPVSVSAPAPIPSSSKSITSFIFKAADNPSLAADISGMISSDTILISVPYNVNLGNLKPTIVHTGKSITPGSGSSQDFSVIVGYKVTAADNTDKIYKAIVRGSLGGTMYVGSNDGKLYALDPDNGALKWTYATGGAIGSASPTFYNGTVFICSADKYLHAVDAATGLLKWKFLTNRNVSGTTPTLFNGNLYFGCNPETGPRFSINAQTGGVNWQVGNAVSSNFTINNGKGFGTFSFGTFYYTLNGFDINTGAFSVSFPGSWIYGNSNPLVGNGIVYVGREACVTSAYNANTGASIWNFSGALNDHCLTSGPTAKNGKIYNGGAVTGNLYAMDSATGVARWVYDGPNTFSSPVVAHNIVFAGNINSFFYAIDANIGTLKWRFGDPGIRTVGANNGTVAGNNVYFGSYNNKIYCLDAITGAVIWQYLTGGAVYSGPLIVTVNQEIFHPGQSGEHQ